MNLTKKLNEVTLKEVTKAHRKFILNTQYGKLALLRPMLRKAALNSESNIIHDIVNIDNSASANYLKMVLKKKHDYLFFIPKTNFGNSHQIFTSTKDKVIEQYFGTSKKPNNPFEKCKSPQEIFHLSQNIKTSINKTLSRIGYMLFKTGEVNIIHKETSILRNNLNIQAIFKDLIKQYESTHLDDPDSIDKFSKHDYFFSCSLYEGIISSNNYISKGVEVADLGNRKIYPQFGVFNITRQDYISMFNRYLREKMTDFNFESSNAIDLGCGTGILSFLLVQRGMKRVFAIDNLENAIIATQSNAQALGYLDKIKAVKLDLKAYYDNVTSQSAEGKDETKVKVTKGIKHIERQKNYDQLLLTHQIDNMFDLIVVNPPWLNSNPIFSQLEYDNAVFDAKHAFLSSAFGFARTHLSRINSKSKFIVIFSDLGNLLGINKSDIIEQLAKANNFKITNIYKENSRYALKATMDPLKNFKKESKLIIYELQRV